MNRFMKHVVFFSIVLASFVMAGSAQTNPFAGSWALSLFGNVSTGNSAGWLDIRQEDSYLDGDLLWRWGSVEPLASAVMKNGNLVVTWNSNFDRKKDAAGKVLRSQNLTTWFECELAGDKTLFGTAWLPDGKGQNYEAVRFIGKRMPSVPQAPDPARIKFGKPVRLFNGKDLSGWEMVVPTDANGWKVENGVLVNDPVQKEGQPHINYGNIKTKQAFEDFNLKLQVNVPKHSNSGVYLRGKYEVQIVDSYGNALDTHNMAAVYSRIAPSVAAEKPAGEWQDVDITLCDRHVTILLNGVKIIDNKPVAGITGGALCPDVTAAGPIYLQGDHGKVLYRNIVLTPIVR
jgi:hypothetical protein